MKNDDFSAAVIVRAVIWNRGGVLWANMPDYSFGSVACSVEKDLRKAECEPPSSREFETGLGLISAKALG